MRASAFLAVSLASRVVAFSPSSRVGARVLGPNRFSARLYSQAAYRGPTQERVEAALQESFSPTFLEVLNESHGKQEDESHFKAIIVSEAFAGKTPIARHRLVNAALKDPASGELPFHSLTIVAKTESQWEADNSVPASPQCAGGDGSGLLR